jgi:preprotein translocase subunit YajC
MVPCCEPAAEGVTPAAYNCPVLADAPCGASALFLKDTPVFLISDAHAQSAANSVGGSGGLMSMLPLVLMFVVLYFVMIRPQMKRQKETKAMLDALAKGDEVVTQGGVIGKITKLGDTFAHVEVANGVELQVQRVAIIQVLPKGSYK